MRNAQNTQFPHLDEIKVRVDELAEDRLDVHTVTVRLNNGGWDVTFEATDDDLQSVTIKGNLTNNGAVVWDDNRKEQIG